MTCAKALRHTIAWLMQGIASILELECGEGKELADNSLGTGSGGTLLGHSEENDFYPEHDESSRRILNRSILWYDLRFKKIILNYQENQEAKIEGGNWLRDCSTIQGRDGCEVSNTKRFGKALC